MNIVFAGTPDFASAQLDFLLKQQHHSIVGVFTQPDRPTGRGRKTKSSPVKKLAKDNNLQIFQPKSFKEMNAVEALKRLRADVMVVVAYGVILPKHVLEIPQFGCINIHASLLPRWRGAAPIQRSIEAGDHETGVSIMQMDEGLDTGDVICFSRCKIEPTDNASSLSHKLACLGGPGVIASLDAIAEGRAIAVKQDDSLSCYAPKIQKTEALIDWSEEVFVIERKIRAYNPAPGAYTLIEGKRIKIWDAFVFNKSNCKAFGTILSASEQGLVVACGTGTLMIVDIQLEGRPKMKVSEALKSRRELLSAGRTLGL